MKPSDLIWDFLNKYDRNTRGEANEAFVDVVLQLIKDDSSGNGAELDALESVVNNYFTVEDVTKIVAEWEELENEDWDNEDE
jgi:hypothetical protein